MTEPKLSDPIVPGVNAGTKVLCALSGGADSVALLFLLKDAQLKGSIAELYAAHYHHGLRKESADRDLTFSRALCGRLGIPFFFEKGDVTGFMESTGMSCETAARTLRYEFLEKARCEAGADVIATAHHLDDQAETLLMHLVRGTGPKGLSGMLPKTGNVIRPLLGYTHAELTEYLLNKGETWCEDETNLVPDARRNKLRLEIMPLLKQLNPNLPQALGALAERMQEDEAYFAPLAEELLKKAERVAGFDRQTLSEAPAPVRKRALMRIVSEMLSADFTANDVESVESLLTGQSGRRAQFRGGHTAEADGPLLVIDPVKTEAASQRIPESGSVRFGGWIVSVERTEGFERPEDAYTACIAADAFEDGTVTVRSFEQGDRFRPMGLGGSRLVSDIFIDRKVPHADRQVPLVLMGGEIVFIPGYTVSESVRVNDKTKRFVRITVRKG